MWQRGRLDLHCAVVASRACATCGYALARDNLAPDSGRGHGSYKPVLGFAPETNRVRILTFHFAVYNLLSTEPSGVGMCSAVYSSLALCTCSSGMGVNVCSLHFDIRPTTLTCISQTRKNDTSPSSNFTPSSLSILSGFGSYILYSSHWARGQRVSPPTSRQSCTLYLISSPRLCLGYGSWSSTSTIVRRRVP